MTEIEQRKEAGPRPEPTYTRRFTEEDVEKDKHRAYVGGKWDEVGRLQRDFLVDEGLEPHHRLLDVGCGSLRGGVQFVDYLDSGNYYGLDVNANVIAAGYDYELTDEQRKRLPVTNLLATDRFDTDFGVDFDVAIAQSVFTHVSLNHVRLCMYRVARVLKPGGTFYATFYERPAGYPVDGRHRNQFTERNAYWYYRRDMRWASKCANWRFHYLGKWGHPRGQRMIALHRLPD